MGDTIIGTKGRVAFEAPAAETLLVAHRELEKLVLTARQQRIKELVAQPYGDLVHEGQLLDPVCRDIEALLRVIAGAGHGGRAAAAASRLIVCRRRRICLFAHGGIARRCMGESAGEWTAADALGFSKIAALTGMFHRRAGERGDAASP